MGIRDQKAELLKRLEAKTLDAQFLTSVQHGLGCSPFEAEAVLGAVLEVYGPFLGRFEHGSLSLPGQIRLVAVDAEEPAGKPIIECLKRTVILTVHRGKHDDQLLHKGGAMRFRRARIVALCQEALSQGALLTREDLASRVFFVSPATISRDLRSLREKDPNIPIPLRSTVQDIGPILTHRVQIVRLWLEGKTTSQICSIMRHSASAVDNYVSTFMRVTQLAEKDMSVSQMAFLIRRGKGLVSKYIQLLEECRKEPNYAYHLEQLLIRGTGAKKKGDEGRSNHEKG